VYKTKISPRYSYGLYRKFATTTGRSLLRNHAFFHKNRFYRQRRIDDGRTRMTFSHFPTTSQLRTRRLLLLLLLLRPLFGTRVDITWSTRNIRFTYLSSFFRFLERAFFAFRRARLLRVSHLNAPGADVSTVRGTFHHEFGAQILSHPNTCTLEIFVEITESYGVCFVLVRRITYIFDNETYSDKCANVRLGHCLPYTVYINWYRYGNFFENIIRLRTQFIFRFFLPR